MSTQTTETATFIAAEAKKRPTLICVGTVGEVADAYYSESGLYVVQPISIEPLDSGTGIKVFLLYRPEWLVPGFEPSDLKETEGGAGAYFVYGKNIHSDEDISTLRGLAGSQEAFETLAGQLLSLTVKEGEDGPDIDDVTQVLRSFFTNNVDANGTSVRIGYVLRQQRKKTDRVDENGKPIYQLDKRYEVEKYFDVNEKSLKSQANRAAKSGGDVKFTFEAGTPF